MKKKERIPYTGEDIRDNDLGEFTETPPESITILDSNLSRETNIQYV